jgi:hypothetical protein
VGVGVGVCQFDKLIERLGIVDRDLAEHFAIEQNASALDAVDEAAVAGAAHAAGGSDACDPQAAEIAAAQTAIDERLAAGTHDRDLGLLLVTVFGSPVAACGTKQSATGLRAGGAFANARHDKNSFADTGNRVLRLLGARSANRLSISDLRFESVMMLRRKPAITNQEIAHPKS